MLSFKRPGVTLGLVIVMFGLEQFLQTRSVFFLNRSNIVNIGVGGVVGLASVRWFLKNQRKFSIESVQIASILLIVFSFASQFWTLAPKEFNQYYGKAIPYFALYLLVAPVITLDKKGVRNGIKSALCVGIPLVILFVFLVDWEGRGIRLAAPTVSNGVKKWYSPPLALSSMAAYVGILAVIVVPKQRIFQVLHFVAFAFAFYVAYRTQSRGQLLAMGFVTLVCYPLANQASNLKGLFATLAGFIVLAAVTYFAFSQLNLGGVNRWNEESFQKSFDGRGHMIERLFLAWSSGGAGVLLCGLGSASSFKVSGFYVHNLPAEILGELGLVGISLFLFIYGQVVIKSMNIFRKLEHYPDSRREAVALVGLFMFSSIISLKQGSLFSWPHLFFFAITISQMERHSRQIASQGNMLKQMLYMQSAQMVPSEAVHSR